MYIIVYKKSTTHMLAVYILPTHIDMSLILANQIFILGSSFNFWGRMKLKSNIFTMKCELSSLYKNLIIQILKRIQSAVS